MNRIGQNITRTNQGVLETTDVENNYEPIDLYMTTVAAEPVLSATAVPFSSTVTVESATWVLAGDAITFNEKNRYFQSIVKQVDGNTITLQHPVDYAYTSNAYIYTGKWNLNLDGSSSDITALINSPAEGALVIRRLLISIEDDAAIDSSKFGGISELTNGMYVRIRDGFSKNGALVVNNAGFGEIGFALEYDEKVPAGTYSMRASKYYYSVNGTSITLDSPNTNYGIVIRDNLTALTKITATISGHMRVK